MIDKRIKIRADEWKSQKMKSMLEPTDWVEKEYYTEMVLDKYKQNLKVIGSYIYSYDTRVAWIDRYSETVYIDPAYYKYSKTTSKHINYVANELGYPTKVYYYNELPN